MVAGRGCPACSLSLPPRRLPAIRYNAESSRLAGYIPPPSICIASPTSTVTSCLLTCWLFRSSSEPLETGNVKHTHHHLLPAMILRRAPRILLPCARAPYLSLCRIAPYRRAVSSSTPRPSSSSYNRSDFGGSGYTSEYVTDQPTRGPLGDTSNVECSITPKQLKTHLDKFVVGQDRAKLVLSVAVHEHYLRVKELQAREEEQARLEAQQRRSSFNQWSQESGFSTTIHPVEGEWTMSSL